MAALERTAAETPETIEGEARDWVLRLAAGDDAGAEQACGDWRAADPANEAAFAAAWRAWQRIAETPIAVSGNWRDEAAAMRRAPTARLGRFIRSSPVRYGVPTAIAASVAALFLIPQSAPAPDLRVATAVAQIRTLALDDGSRVTVGARSGVDVDYDDSARRIVLNSGQAFFEVAHDPSRPFLVIAGNAEIRVLGTKFDVRRIGDDVRVSVLEGRVEVRERGSAGAPSSAEPAQVLIAGQRTDVHEQGVEPIQPAVVTPGEWRRGRLYYADAPLSEILADAQRYSATPIRADGAVLNMRLTVSFRTDDIGRFVSDIEAALPVEAQRGGDGAIVLTAAR